MTNDIFQSAQDATLLSVEEKEGLIQSHIMSRGELNRSEQANILAAEEWVFKRDRDVTQIDFLNALHQRMFGRVWNWAGRFRKSGKNIGVDAYRIPGELKLLCDDCNFWLEHAVYSIDEIAARFHHRLVFIHCYPNGNGRHARLAADALLVSRGYPRFTWGARNAKDPRTIRSDYIQALKRADRHDYQKLLDFVRS